MASASETHKRGFLAKLCFWRSGGTPGGKGPAEGAPDQPPAGVDEVLAAAKRTAEAAGEGGKETLQAASAAVTQAAGAASGDTPADQRPGGADASTEPAGIEEVVASARKTAADVEKSGGETIRAASAAATAAASQALGAVPGLGGGAEDRD